MSFRTRAGYLLRGGLIGAAEAVPGISGGTVALVTGVYDVVIGSAGHLVSGVRALLTDRARARAEFRAVRWDVLVPLLLGMAPVLVVALLLLAPAIERYPVVMRSLLLGMVAAAVSVPVMMVGRWRVRDLLLATGAAAVGFLLAGQIHLTVTPTLPAVFVGAAVAVCALVLPGVSGSYILLTFGMYESTAQAIRELDFVYIGVFGLGMVVGLALFVKGLQWLLKHHRRVTMAAATGLIAGALRGVWPWQTDDRGLLAPSGDVALTVSLFLLGAATVLTILMIERRAARRAKPPVSPEPSVVSPAA